MYQKAVRPLLFVLQRVKCNIEQRYSVSLIAVMLRPEPVVSRLRDICNNNCPTDKSSASILPRGITTLTLAPPLESVSLPPASGLW